MRIVYPLSWSRLEREASRQQSISTAAALARQGAEVSLLMPRGGGDEALTAQDLRTYFGVEGDFDLVQRPSRWAGYGLLPSLMWIRQLFSDPAVRAADLLYSRIPALLAMGGASPLPFASDHYRPWPDQLPAIRPLVRRTSRHQSCLGIILHSHYAARAYRRAGVPEERILVAHNGADPHGGKPLDKAAARSRLDLPRDRPTAVYAGRIGRDKGLDQIAALAARRPEILFLLVGARGDAAEADVVCPGENLRLVEWQDSAALRHWLAAADLLLVPPSRAPLERFGNCVLPMKLFSYLAAGKPILAPALPDSAELLTDEENALLVPPNEPQAAAAALDRLVHDAALGRRLGAAARRLSEGLTWDARASKIVDFLRERLAQRSLYSSTVTPISAAIAGAVQAPTAAGK